MLLDIHSHVLPAVDDGAKNLDMSIKLLEIMAQQGITNVIATPHFYPSEDTLEEFKEKTAKALYTLNNIKQPLPDIILGCELYYFNGISRSEHIREFTLGNSDYLLLEPCYSSITKGFLSEVLYLKNELNIIPIIPHIERYYKTPGFKMLLKCVKENKILTQVNAASFLYKSYNRILKKLFKEKLITFIATDTHSLRRPPMMADALLEIEKRFGIGEKQRIISNLETLYNNITVEAVNHEIEHTKYL